MSSEEARRTRILLITGPAGVGKSTLTWEIAGRLAGAGLAHAVIETDELDRVFPLPTPGELDSIRPGTTDVSAINLAALWSTYRALGHTRLIMSGVMVRPESDLRWIADAIPGAEVAVVRLRASDATLLARLDRRETGSGREDQIRRSLRQADQMAGEPADGLIVITADDATPADLADRVLRAVGWLEGPGDRTPAEEGA